MYATPANLGFLIAAGSCVGILGALLGTGGGVFLIPVLVLIFKVPMHYAVATSIISVVATSSAVASTNVERGTANMRLGMVLEIATAVGAILGGITAGWISATHLEALFAIVLMPTALSMWRGREGEQGQAATHTSPTAGDSTVGSPPASPPDDSSNASWSDRISGRYFDPQTNREVVYRVDRLWAGLLISFIAGNLSGLLGIGGGVFKVPALHLLCHVPFRAAAATSNFMIGVTAAASSFLYFGRGEVRPALTATIVLGVLGGSIAGSYINQFVRGHILNKLFAVLLVGVSLQMLVRAVWIGG